MYENFLKIKKGQVSWQAFSEAVRQEIYLVVRKLVDQCLIPFMQDSYICNVLHLSK